MSVLCARLDRDSESASAWLFGRLADGSTEVKTKY